jgi:hypothetical protein
MIYPEKVILAVGGSHGDFLINSCRIMQGEEIKNNITKVGQSKFLSEFKIKTQFRFQKGKKQDLQLNEVNDIELSHIWYDEFQNYPSKFFYIAFSKEILPVIIKMYLTKVCSNNLQKAVDYFKYYTTDGLSKKINTHTISKILPIIWWNTQKKYQQQKNIEGIQITDLYDYDKFLKLLKRLDVYKKNNEKQLKEYHTKWQQKNFIYINEIKALSKNI